MAVEPNTEDQATEGASSLTAGLLIQTIEHRGTSLRRIVLGILFSSRIRKTIRLRKASSYEPLATASTAPDAASDHVIDIPLQERFSNNVARIVRETDLNSLRALGGVDGILPLLRSQFEDGAVDGGQNPQGWNVTKSPVDAKGFLYFLFEACNQYTIFFLLLSAGLSFAIEFMSQGVKYGWHDGVGILIAALLLIAFPSVGKYRYQRKLARKHLRYRSKLMVNVERSSTPIALFQWSNKAAKNQAVPQNLSACVTMGLINVICIETTAELMCNPTEVKEVWIGEEDLSIGEVNSETDQVLKALHQGISATASPTNDLLISWLNTRWGSNAVLPDRRFETVEERQLSSDEKCRGILVRKIENDEQIMQVHCDGDAATILGMCSHYYDNRGECHNIGNQKRKLEQVIKKMEKDGRRPIAYAYKKTQAEELTGDGLILLALVGLRCPYQEELKLAVKALREAGVSIKLVSEDELSIVRATASELGISPASDDKVIEGQAFRRLNSMERPDAVDLISVMGSSLPKDKFLMVEGLKKKGRIVAFYGGLTIRDTLTLKEADVGIVHDIWRTGMARESADLIIGNGCFLSKIVNSGACAYHNIQHFSQLQLTACISGLLVTLVATMHSGESPLTAVHLIWVNLIMCLLGGLMMVMELQGTLQHIQRPEERTESLITKVIRRNIAVQVLYQVSVLLILHFMPSVNEGVRNTMIFSTFTLCQVLNLFSAMDLVKKEVLVVVLHSHWFLMALGAVLTMQVIVVEFGKELASCVKLNALQWLICFTLAALSWGSDRAIKFLSAHLQRATSALRVSSRVGFSHRDCRLYILIWLFLIFSVSSYCFHPENSQLSLYIR